MSLLRDRNELGRPPWEVELLVLTPREAQLADFLWRRGKAAQLARLLAKHRAKPTPANGGAVVGKDSVGKENRGNVDGDEEDSPERKHVTTRRRAEPLSKRSTAGASPFKERASPFKERPTASPSKERPKTDGGASPLRERPATRDSPPVLASGPVARPAPAPAARPAPASAARPAPADRPPPPVRAPLERAPPPPGRLPPDRCATPAVQKPRSRIGQPAAQRPLQQPPQHQRQPTCDQSLAQPSLAQPPERAPPDAPPDAPPEAPPNAPLDVTPDSPPRGPAAIAAPSAATSPSAVAASFAVVASFAVAASSAIAAPAARRRRRGGNVAFGGAHESLSSRRSAVSTWLAQTRVAAAEAESPGSASRWRRECGAAAFAAECALQRQAELERALRRVTLEYGVHKTSSQRVALEYEVHKASAARVAELATQLKDHLVSTLARATAAEGEVARLTQLHGLAAPDRRATTPLARVSDGDRGRVSDGASGRVADGDRPATPTSRGARGRGDATASPARPAASPAARPASPTAARSPAAARPAAAGPISAPSSRAFPSPGAGFVSSPIRLVDGAERGDDDKARSASPMAVTPRASRAPRRNQPRTCRAAHAT
ncbi:hypothetical protein M885DRAFT_507866 [Pelagophyceae sp. CCMP2097]|nr:hypothetical protein M885DRAFT_507866 [Pelagophyceae sp. CCMP2097]